MKFLLPLNIVHAILRLPFMRRPQLLAVLAPETPEPPES